MSTETLQTLWKEACLTNEAALWRERAERAESELARVTADMAALQAKAEHWRETALIAEGETARLRGELQKLRGG